MLGSLISDIVGSGDTQASNVPPLKVNVAFEVAEGPTSSPDEDSQFSIPDLLAEAIEDDERGTSQYP
jgi:hypothetical protein